MGWSQLGQVPNKTADYAAPEIYRGNHGRKTDNASSPGTDFHPFLSPRQLQTCDPNRRIAVNVIDRLSRHFCLVSLHESRRDDILSFISFESFRVHSLARELYQWLVSANQPCRLTDTTIKRSSSCPSAVVFGTDATSIINQKRPHTEMWNDRWRRSDFLID